MKKALFIIALAIFCSTSSHAQTPSGYCTVLHNACANDGELIITITQGMTPPIDVVATHFYAGSGYLGTMQALIDTLTSLPFVENIRLTDINGVQLYLYTQFPSLFYIDNFSITDPVCPDTTGLVTVTIDGGIMPASVSYYEFSYTNSIFVSSGNPLYLETGYYTAYICDSAGCCQWDSSGTRVELQSPLNIYTSHTPSGCNNGTVTLDSVSGGIPPYFHVWQNGLNTQTVANLHPGSFYITVTDSQGCTGKKQNSISASSTINGNCTSQSSVCTSPTGSVTAFGSGGTPPYSYNWSIGQNTQSISGLVPGYYSVTITDANECTTVRTEEVDNLSPITVTYSSTPTGCVIPDGAIDLIINGGNPPYSVLWSVFPPQSGMSITGLMQGNYSFTVTDLSGCSQTGTATVPGQSSLSMTISSTQPTCPLDNGILIAGVIGTNPPFTFLWSNGNTTGYLDSLASGIYHCTVTDDNGCTVSESIELFGESSLTATLITTPSSCLFTPDGTCTINVSGGIPPYLAHWGNYTTSLFSDTLLTGFHNIYITDATGCGLSKTFFITTTNSDSCYCTIKGKVFVDGNSNCLYDTGEEAVQNIWMECNNLYHWTSNTGEFEFILPTGSYTLSEQVMNYYPLAACQSNHIPVVVTAASGCVIERDFAHTINPIHDMQLLNTPIVLPVPGHSYTQHLVIRNSGTIAESNIFANTMHDGQLPLNNFVPALFTTTSPVYNTTIPAFPTLQPGEAVTITKHYNVPTNIPIGTSLWFLDTVVHELPVSNWMTDYSPWNNVKLTSDVVVGSYDPNMKEVYPAGIGPEGYITTEDSILTYTIHFENTGTYYAENIYITDSLDPNLDMHSLIPVYGSHPFTTEMNQNGVVKFSFNDINLPWGSYYIPDLDKGYVVYSIIQKPGLLPGAEIRNKAAIYFDYNEPVITNEVLNTIAPLNSSEIKKEVTIGLYPNPAGNSVHVIWKDCIAVSTGVYDLSGRNLMEVDVRKRENIELPLGNLSPGTYLVIVTDHHGIKHSSLLIRQ